MRNGLCGLVALAALVAFPRAASAQDDAWRYPVPSLEIGLQNSISRDGYEPSLELSIALPMSRLGGVSCFMQTRTTYAQTYCGAYYLPTSWLTVSVSVGLESADQPGRVAGSLSVDAGRFALFGLFEYGGSGWRHLARATVSLGEHFLVGLMSQRFEGEGVLLGAEFGRWGVYGAYLYDTERYLTEARGRTAWYDGDFFTALLTVAVGITP